MSRFAEPGRTACAGDALIDPDTARRAVMLIEMTIKGLMVDPITNTADRHPQGQGRRARPADLGRHLRGECDRAADRERRHAPADDARPAAQRHHRPRRTRRSRRRQRPEGQHLLRHHPSDGARASASRSTRVRAMRSPWRCGRARRSWWRRRSSTTRRPSTSHPSVPTTTGCRSGWRASIPTNLGSTRCELSAGRQSIPSSPNRSVAATPRVPRTIAVV